jgi:hypothetical protein
MTAGGGSWSTWSAASPARRRSLAAVGTAAPGDMGAVSVLGCHHRPRRGPLPPDHRGPGDYPAGALRQGLAVQSRGANGAERSELALDGTCEPCHSLVEHRPERVRSLGGRERARATSSVSGRRRRTVRAPPGGSLVPGDAGGTGTLALRRRHVLASEADEARARALWRRHLELDVRKEVSVPDAARSPSTCRSSEAGPRRGRTSWPPGRRREQRRIEALFMMGAPFRRLRNRNNEPSVVTTRRATGGKHGA